ncbi:hypothetical protein CD148_12800, partial [Staphylococcus delphini]
EIDINDFNVVISSRSTPLGEGKEDSSLLAGVSSFGFGGTNAHIILESYKENEKMVNRPFKYNSVFLPWNRVPNPLLSNRVNNRYISDINEEVMKLWEDHKINEEVIVPASNHIATLAGAALLDNTLENSKGVLIENTLMINPLVINDNISRIICCNTTNNNYVIKNDKDVKFAECGDFRLLFDRSKLENINIERISQQCDIFDENILYNSIKQYGVDFGPKYRNLKNVYIGKSEAIADIEVDYQNSLEKSLSLLHPATIDASLQLLGFCSIESSGICIPFHIEKAEVYFVEEQPKNLFAYAKIDKSEKNHVEGTVIIFDENNEVVTRLSGVTSRGLNTKLSKKTEDNRSANNIKEHVYESKWELINSSKVDFNMNETSYLVISEGLIDNLPSNWKQVDSKDLDIVKAIIQFKTWDGIIVINTDSEDNVYKALEILKYLASDSNIIQTPISFVSHFDNVNDSGIQGLLK